MKMGKASELNTNVPSELSQVIQATIILFIAAQASFAGYLNDFVLKVRHSFDRGQKGGGEIGHS